MAVLSDIDDSDRARSAAYHGTLIRSLGLDFGDSMWLLGRLAALSDTPRTGDLLVAAGLGVFHPDGLSTGWRPSDLDTVRTFPEMVVGALRGDFDHFHAFMPRGHRVVWLERTDTDGAEAVFTVPPLQRNGYFSTSEVRVAGLGVVGTRAAVDGVHEARTTGRRDSSEVRLLTRAEPHRETALRLGLEGEGVALLLPPPSGPDAPPRPPLAHLWLVDEIRVTCASPEAAAGLRAVAVFNATPELILNALTDLDEQWNVRTSLITEHSGYCFLNTKSQAIHGGKVLAESQTPSPDLRGWVIGLAEGPMRFSGLADDPGSFCRLFPALVAERGFRFVNAGGLTGSPDFSFDIHDVVAPSRVRDGSGVYICRRTMPTLPEGVDRDDPVLKPTRAPSFGHRLRRLYQLMESKPGCLWPFYTHLGGVQPLEQNPEPYLEPGPVLELQDRVYGITGRFEPGDRCWFVRGTGMCEHALLMQNLADRVERVDADTVRITPWHDEVLGYALPASINQTYGLTFRVRHLDRARVLVGEREVSELARFDHPDGKWVTLTPSSIREVLFHHVDPLARPDARVSIEGLDPQCLPGGGEDGGGVALRLVTPRGQIGRVSFTPNWIDPAGAQCFLYNVRADDRNAAVAWLVETTDGGRFAWGDQALVETISGLTAWRFEPAPMAPTVSVPLWDLTWSPGALPGGPLPSRNIARIELICRGVVSISNAAFLRPSPAQRDEPVSGVVVAGRVPEAMASEWTVCLQALGTPTASQCTPDPRGWFGFPGVRGTAAHVWAEDRQGRRHAPRGGDTVETRWNQTALVFDPSA